MPPWAQSLAPSRRPASPPRLGIETPRRLHDPLHPTRASARAATTFSNPTARRSPAQRASRYTAPSLDKLQATTSSAGRKVAPKGCAMPRIQRPTRNPSSSPLRCARSGQWSGPVSLLLRLLTSVSCANSLRVYTCHDVASMNPPGVARLLTTVRSDAW
jgi:hypothetical protein